MDNNEQIIAELTRRVSVLEQMVEVQTRELSKKTDAKSEGIKRDIFTRRVSLATTDIDRSIGLSGNSQTIQVLAYPNGFWEVEIEGRRYNIPYYYAS